MKHTRKTLLFLGVLCIAGCGGGSGSGGGTPPPPITRGEAHRFLTQASFGPDAASIPRVIDGGYERWIDEQLRLPATKHLDYMRGLRPTNTQMARPARQFRRAIRGRTIDYVVIAARGTSDNAGRYAQYLLGSVNQLMVTLATPSLYSIYKRPPRFGNALVIGISQSGKSPDIVSVLAEAHRQGALTAAITNFPDSDLGRQCEHVITLHAGEERSIAATKTYTASLAAIAALSTELAGDEQMRAALLAIPEKMEAELGLSPQIGVLTERYRYMRDCVVLGLSLIHISEPTRPY